MSQFSQTGRGICPGNVAAVAKSWTCHISLGLGGKLIKTTTLSPFPFFSLQPCWVPAHSSPKMHTYTSFLNILLCFSPFTRVLPILAAGGSVGLLFP